MENEQLCILVEAAKSGDADAFGKLYAAYYKSLYKTAYYLMGDPQDAEDIVMETVADAYTGIRALRAAQAFEGWLYKILYNKARRKRGLIVRRATVELNENLQADTPDAEQISRNVDLLRALDALKPQDRAIVVLAVCEGYSSAAIAQIMGMNPNTVRSRQMRALAKMRALLQEKGEEK